MKSEIKSPAYLRAALKSEQFRTFGLLLVIAGFIAFNVIRASVVKLDGGVVQRFVFYTAFWSACGIYEFTLLLLTRRAYRQNRQTWFWVAAVNTVIECSFPTIAIVGLSVDKSYLGPYLALASGNVLLYSFFIILSTLRLSPALSILAGVVSGAEYAGVYLLTLSRAANNANRAVFPPETFIITAVLLLAAGLLAAGVARQIRQHVIAALNEAETRRKLDRVEHDLQIARTIQMGLLPRNAPNIPGYDIAGWSQPADQTGGDYYDWMELPGGRVMFTIADAAGHGIGPALLVTACRAYFRALAAHDDPLESITRQVDALVAADIPAGRFITAAVAMLEPAEHQLYLYSAGHGPLYLYTAKGDKVEMFDADQPPLGVRMVDDETPRARRIPLESGDALVLVTDGFFEGANSAGQQIGTEGLADLIGRHQACPAAELISRLHREVTTFAGGVVQGDDLTAVVIKRKN